MSSPQLQIIKRESWQREFVADRNNELLGNDTWYAEYLMYDSEVPDIPVHTSSTDNGLVKWLMPGVLRVTIPEAKLRNLDFKQAGFVLRIVDKNDTTEDPAGRSWVVCRGLQDIIDPFEVTTNTMRVF